MSESEAGVNDVRARALSLLARREHARKELERKLTRHFDPQLVGTVLDELHSQGLQSEERFCDSFVRSRVQRGQGPMKIRSDLRTRGVSEHNIDQWLTFPTCYWLDQVRVVRAKKFGSCAPTDAKERARQARFLAQRGFPADIIYSVVQESSEDLA